MQATVFEKSRRTGLTSSNEKSQRTRKAGDEHLTSREREILSWICLGKKNREIADKLGISIRTVEKHIQNLFGKLGVDNRTVAAGLQLLRL